MDPMISEDAAEVDMKPVSCRQMAQNSLQIALLLWAWFQCWSGMFFHGFQICEGSKSITHIMPMVVLVVGLVMTNVIGCVHFRQKGLWRDACLAAVDLDSPYLAYRHGRQIILGKPCPDWELLRLRNSIWRSLPLAMVGFVLAFRIILEIPMCQAVGTLSTFSVGTFPELIPYSKFAEDLSNAGVNLTELRKFQAVQGAAQRIPDAYKGQRSLELGAKAIHLEGELWAAAECKNSEWDKHDITYALESQDWLDAVLELEKMQESLGGIGSANLLAFDYMFFQYLKPKLSFSQTEDAETLAKETDFENERMVISVASHRPWRVGSDKLHFELKDGWKIWLLQSFILLLVAILPIRKKILQACQITTPLPMALVTLHTSLDTVSLVTSWLLCTMASAAYLTGQCLERGLAAILPLARQVARESLNRKTLRAAVMHDLGALREEVSTSASELLAKYAVEHGGQFLDLIHDTVVPAIAWDPYFFLYRVVGTLAFLVISALLSRWLCPQRFAMCISVGVCGPLWLLTEGGEEEDTFEATVQGVGLLMLFRNFLLAAFVFVSWFFVNSDSIQLFFALICNRVLDVTCLKLSCLALFAANGLTGLLATVAIYNLLRKSSRDGPSAQPAHMFLASSHNSAYGTFEARSEQSLPV